MRYSNRVIVPKGSVIRGDDLVAILGLSQSLVGPAAQMTWSVTTGFSEVAGDSLDELTSTFAAATSNPSGFNASVFDGSADPKSPDRPTITIDLRSKEPRVEIVGSNGEWAARAAREIRVEMAERGVRKSYARRVPIGAAVVIAFSVLFGLALASAPRTDGGEPLLPGFAPYNGAIGLGAILLATGWLALASVSSARLSIVRSEGAARWLDATFVRGMLAMATLIGLAWTIYQVVKAILSK